MIIANTDQNRNAIKNYLQNVNEDDFIESVVIPLFSVSGYTVYRINSHGGGEHGKDVVFYKHMPLFTDSEYVVAQAKAEKVTVGNVVEFSYQLLRALKTPIKAKSGNASYHPAYAVFINARKHTNEACFEFPFMTDTSSQIKILSQDDVCEAMMRTGIIPSFIKNQIEISIENTSSDEDRTVVKTLLENDVNKVAQLMDHKLKLTKNKLNASSKKMIIDYIFLLWDEDRSWAGTVKPMKWLNSYFSFLLPEHYPKLFDVLDEYTSRYDSRDARSYTSGVVRQITAKMLYEIEELFIAYVANRILHTGTQRIEKIYELVEDYLDLDKFKDNNSKEILILIQQMHTAKRESNIENYRASKNKLRDIISPDD